MENIKKVAHDYKLVRSKSEQVFQFLCHVKSLRDNEYESIMVSRENSGQWLLDEVCERFGGIQEKDYFGLRYTDKDKQRQWLDLGHSVYAQLKGRKKFKFFRKNTQPVIVSFRMKHFPAEPLTDLLEERALYFLYLQLRRDLFSGRLLGKSADSYQLAAYAVQDELGDYELLTEETTLMSQLKLLPNLNSRTEPKITDLHRNLAGLSSPETRQKFLEKACQLDTYGVEPFYVKDQKGNNLYVGLTHEGVSTFQGSRRAHLFRWTDIYKILFRAKLFIIHVYLDEIYNSQPTKKKHVLGFKCESSTSAEALWKWANDRMCFFSLNRSSEAKRVKSGGGLLKKRRTFKFSGRCQREIQNLSRSMNCLDVSDGNGVSRRNTLIRDNPVSEEDQTDGNRNRFHSMPNRDKGKILGTQETLDSLFSALTNVPVDSSNEQDDQDSSPGQERDRPLDHGGPSQQSQSLDNIVEETIQPSFTDYEMQPLHRSNALISQNEPNPKGVPSTHSSLRSSHRDLGSQQHRPLVAAATTVPAALATRATPEDKDDSNSEEVVAALQHLTTAVSAAVSKPAVLTRRQSLGHRFCILLLSLAGVAVLVALLLSLLLLVTSSSQQRRHLQLTLTRNLEPLLHRATYYIRSLLSQILPLEN